MKQTYKLVGAIEECRNIIHLLFLTLFSDKTKLIVGWCC